MNGQGQDAPPHPHAAGSSATNVTVADGTDGAQLGSTAPTEEGARFGHGARAVAEDVPTTPVEINALLGRGTEFEGKLHFDGRVRIEGSFRGEIRGDDVLVIGDGAHIVGSIEVATCIITGGEVEANVRARDAIELYAPAVVHGDLHAPAVFIDRGVQFQGNCKMAPLDDDDALAEPAAPLPGGTNAPAIGEPPREADDLDNAPTVSHEGGHDPAERP